MKSKIKVDFFHDVVCSWCYVISPRLRKLAEELSLDVHHHAFALSATKEDMVQMFGSRSKAKKVILGHWQQCAKVEDQKRINVEGMRQKNFEYPTSLPGLLGCKAAQKQAGDKGHWDYFDAVQRAHLSENRNIADSEVLISLAVELGLDVERFKEDCQDPELQKEIMQDQQLAQKLGIQAVPTLVINDRWILSGAQPLDVLRSQIQQIQMS